MKNLRFINVASVIFLLMIILLSCNRDEIFEREQYKVVIAMLSDDGFNIFSEEQEFSDELID